MGRPSDYTQELAGVDIYVLRHPVTNEIRYVGKANNAERRLKTHLRDSKKRMTPVCCWVRSLVSDGKCPVIEVIQRVADENWQQAEKDTIVRLRAEGARLLNLAEGGNQPSQTLEQRQENGRRATRARNITPDQRRLWEVKRALGSFVKSAPKNDHYYAIVAKMRLCAQKRPEIFGLWANL